MGLYNKKMLIQIMKNFFIWFGLRIILPRFKTRIFVTYLEY